MTISVASIKWEADMPNGKYLDRPGNGIKNQSLGWDEEDLPMTIKPGGEEHKVVAMPTQPTQDKPASQDGGTGKPFVKTLDSRRGKSDSGSGHDTPGSYGGPNAR